MGKMDVIVDLLQSPEFNFGFIVGMITVVVIFLLNRLFSALRGE